MFRVWGFAIFEKKLQQIVLKNTEKSFLKTVQLRLEFYGVFEVF